MNAKQIEKILRGHLSEEQNREQFQHRIHTLIAQTLRAKWAGKKLTKRLATSLEPQIKEILGDGTRVFWNTDYGLTQIAIWGGSIKFEERWSFYLRTPEACDPTTFEDSDICHGSAAAKRIEARNRLLASKDRIARVAELVARIRSDRAQLEALTEHGTDENEMHYRARDLADRKE